MKQVRKRNYSSLFLKYLLSYIAILLIPVIIITGIMRSSFTDMFDKQVITENLNTLNRLVYIIDNQLNQMQKTVLQIEINKNLRPANLKNNSVRALAIKAELVNYVATNNFVENIFLYYRGSEYIYSSYGSCFIDMFIDDVYHYDSWAKDTFYEDINSVTKNTIYFSKEKGNEETANKYFVFAYPVPSYSTQPYATSLFVVPESSLQNIMTTTVHNYTENTIILDENNNIITYLGNDDYIYTQEFADIVSNLDKGDNVEDVEISDKKHLIFSVSSDNNNWKYISIVPIYKVREDISNIQTKLIFSVLLVLFIGGIAAYFISQLNYKPIKLLNSHAKMIWDGQAGQDEVETVRETLDFLVDKNTRLDKKLQSGQEARREHLLTKLLKGEVGTIDVFNEKGKDAGLVLTKELYRVAMLKFKYMSDVPRTTKKAIIKDLEIQLSYFIEAYARDYIENDKVSLLICYSHDDEESIQTLLVNTKNYIEQKWELVLTIGMGKVYNSIEDIPKSYIEACTALDFRFIKGDSNIISYEEVTKEPNKFNSYPHNNIQKLEVFIKQGDVSNIEAILEELIEFMKDQNTPIFITRRISYDIINIVMRTMNDIYKDFAFTNAKYPDVFKLRDFETVDQLVEVVKAICYDICAYVKEDQHRQCEQMLNNIINYIHANYTDCDFSIQNMAYEFDMSTSSLSQYFKEQTGHNIFDYVSHLKIEKAKELLAETDMLVKEICEDIGYYNVSSFIRRFKQITGLTPGEYRKSMVDI